MGKIMSKEKDARDVALREYDTFMEKYQAAVEAGNMKLMQHMLRLEADKIRTQSILDAIEKSTAGLDENVYGDTKMKLQMSKDEYHVDQAPVDDREQAFIKMASKPISIGDPDKMDTFKIDASNFGQIDPAPKKEVKKEPVKRSSPSITVDPETGRKTYTGPKLRNRKIVDGKVWDSSHPSFHDKGVGGM
tara:strand:- start:159 stop:728 length:570 start_codon:yes stop_codon:yes gene_type:complete